MSVEHKAEIGTFYPPLDLDTVQDAEIVDDQPQSPEMPPVLEFDQLRLSVGVRERKKESHSHTEDAVYINQQDHVFGVFDGAGGAGGNPAAASRVASEAVGESLSRTDRVVDTIAAAEEDLKRAFQNGREAVDQRGEGGTTVATAAKIYTIDGKAFLGVAHAGDTRAFLYSKESQQYYDLTPDQSRGNVIFNALDSKYHSKPSYFRLTPLQAGDRLMLCSDGITGDYAEQFFSSEEYLDAFGQSTADDAAERFMQISLGEQKKPDDKSVIVIDFDQGEDEAVSTSDQLVDESETTGNESEALDRTLAARKKNARMLRESLGLPHTATAAEVSQARKAQRKKSADNDDLDIDIMQVFADDTDLQDQISEAMHDRHSYTVTDKRTWDRETGKPKARKIPAMPDHLPTNHLKPVDAETQDTRTEAPTESIPVQPSQETPVVEKVSLKDKLRNLPAYLAGQMDAYRVIHQNKLEEKYSDEQLTKRNEKQEKALKRVLGVAAVTLVAVAAWKLGHDMASVQDLSAEIGNADGDWVTKVPGPDAPRQSQPVQPEFNAAASTVVSGEGWYQTIQETTGVTDPARQAAILQKIGPVLQEKGLAYPMGDGTWGISRPGALPRDVLELIKNSQ